MTRTRGNLTFLDTTLFGTAPGGGAADSSLLEDPLERSMWSPLLSIPLLKDLLLLFYS